MSKDELLQTLLLIARLEGFILGEVGKHVPEPLSAQLSEVVKMLGDYIEEA